ncbi:MAG TPA: DNA-3-methyladenine glycosylase [Acidimicrobiales bacterium]|nr:DNA-3-methyladenine glycosylase [Acidimicrobiales bacterium]
MGRRRRLSRSFYDRDSLVVAPELLNKVLVAGGCAGRIVEVEAYRGGEDPASHAYRGRTARNAVMFGPPGHLYVYFTYGMHWCANAVCMPDGVAQAVLLRALAPLSGLEEMQARRRAARKETELCSGPARLCHALGITRDHDGADLVGGADGVAVFDDGTPPPDNPATGPRVGIRVAVEEPWRYWVPGDPNVTRWSPMPALPRRRPR